MRSRLCGGMTPAATFLSLLLLSSPVLGQEEIPGLRAEPRPAPAIQEDGLSGRDVYSLILDNHLVTSLADQRIISEDAGGDTQESRFWSGFRDYRDDGMPGSDGIISKSVMQYTFPKDRRDSAYLFVENHRAQNDGFNYSKRREKVARIRTREETVFGSDFTLEDIVAVRVLDDAGYTRYADEIVDSVPVYVIEVTYLPETFPQYSKSLLYVDKEFHVPLRTINWDLSGIKRNVMAVTRDRVEFHGGSWIPMEIAMYDLADRSRSVLYTDAIEANPDLPDRLFVSSRLGRLRR